MDWNSILLGIIGKFVNNNLDLFMIKTMTIYLAGDSGIPSSRAIRNL